MILRKIPRKIIWAKTIECLMNSVPEPAIFIPISISLPPQLGWQRGSREAEPNSALADSDGAWEGGRRSVARCRPPSPPPGGTSGLAQGQTPRHPGCSPRNDFQFLGSLLINIPSRKEAISGTWQRVYKKRS